MDRSEYDSAEGIARHLGSYEALHPVLEARIEAAERGEELGRFVLFNALLLTHEGEVRAVGVEGTPPERIPEVLTVDDHGAWLGAHGLSVSHYAELPVLASPGRPCPACERGWDLESFRAAVPVTVEEELDLTPYTGRTLADLRIFFRSLPVEACVWQRIRRDEWRDPGSEDEDRREGWRDEEDSETPIGDDYRIRAGDTGHLTHMRVLHESCANDEFAERIEVDIESGFEAFRVTMTERLETSGFTGIGLELAPVPDALAAELGRLFGKSPDDPEEAKELALLALCHRAFTEQGTFVILYKGDEPGLVLEGTGLSPGALALEGIVLETGAAAFLPLDSENRVLASLRQALSPQN